MLSVSTRAIFIAIDTDFEVNLFTILKALYSIGQSANLGKASYISWDKCIKTVEIVQILLNKQEVFILNNAYLWAILVQL